MSTLDVVAEVLREVAPRALKARQIAALALDRLPTASRTPETVISRDLAIDVRDRGATSRFLRVDRGAFVLKEALPTAFYNDNDSYAAQWTRNLIAAGEIAAGVVDERSIRDLKPADVASYRQCHFFSGVGVWSRALRDAGWPTDVNVWSGSCPCQPLSQAGQRRGFADERHLWPEWFRLIAACRPAVVVGEQVSSKDGLAWLDLVFADLEGADYTVRAIDIPAASVGGPHARQRLYYVAYARERGRAIVSASWLHDRGQSGNDALGRGTVDGGDAGAVSDAAGPRPCTPQDAGADRGDAGSGTEAIERGSAGDLESQRGGDADDPRAVSDAERVVWDAGRQRGSHGWPEVEPDRHGEAHGAVFGGAAGCGCIGTVGMGDAGLARGGRDTGALPGAQDLGKGERLEAGDLAHQPLAPGAADRTVSGAYACGRSLATEVVRGAVAAAGNGGSEWICHAGAVSGYWKFSNWIYCRPAPGHQDGRWRPVEPVLVKMASGTSAPVGPLCAEEVVDVSAAQTHAAEVLRLLWPQDGTQALQWSARRLECIQAAEVLRSALHGHWDGGDDQGVECRELAKAEREAGGEVLFPLRAYRWEAQRASCGRESAEQRSVEPLDLVRILSSSLAFATLRSDDRTAEALRSLLEACHAERLVFWSSDEAAALWRSLADEDKGRLLVGLGTFRRASISPLVTSQGNRGLARAKRLRGYGNSVVLPLATAFIASVIDAFADSARSSAADFLEVVPRRRVAKSEEPVDDLVENARVNASPVEALGTLSEDHAA